LWVPTTPERQRFSKRRLSASRSHPHKNPETVPYVGYRPNDTAEARVVVHLEAAETKKLLIDWAGAFTVNGDQQQASPSRADEMLALLAEADSFSSVWINNGGALPSSTNGSLTLLQPFAQGRTYAFEVDRAAAAIRFNPNASGSFYEGILAAAIQASVYKFDAERLKVSVASFGTNKDLQPNASNLAEVLNNLQSNKNRF
jgi:hypothetical protein